MTSPNPTPPEDQSSPTQTPINPTQDPQLDLPSDPQLEEPSKTRTLESQNPQPEPPQNAPNDKDEDDPDASNPISPEISDTQLTISTTISNPFTVTRRGGGAKRRKLAHKRRVAFEKSQKKLEIMVGTFKPIPFVPAKNLDFSSHEDLLKRLGLWDFVHIEFDKNIRHDLLLQLVANFSHDQKCSYVNGVRINVTRANLARALNLPVKKPSSVSEGEEEIPASEESIAFIENLLSNWVLLHEDTWMMPSEVLNWTNAIKEGHFERIDWAGLIWFMLEKELQAAPQLVNCYYASHLQCLIGSQREQLLREEEVKSAEVDMKEEEEKEHEEEDGNMGVKMGGDDESRGSGMEEHNIELSLGQETFENAVKVEEVELSLGQETFENVEKVEGVEKEKVGNEGVIGFVENKEEEVEHVDFVENKEQEVEHGQWLLDGKSGILEPFLRRCDFLEVKEELDFEDEHKHEIERAEEERQCEEEEEEQEECEQDEGEQEEEEEEEEEQDDGFHLSPKSNPIDRFNSSNFIQQMDVEQIPFSSGSELRDHFSGEFLSSSRDDSRMISGGSLPFGNNSNKRMIDHDNDNSNQSPTTAHKRLRSETPSDFETCIEQVQHWIGKARMINAEKEQSYQQSTMNQQYLLHELQQRDNIIEHLRKAKFEEQQKRHTEIYKLERELYAMGNLLEGYRKALKETHKSFAEYRARCPQADELLYKDVSGSGGLVLSVMELERRRVKQEEEDRVDRLIIEKRLKEFEEGFIGIFEAHLRDVSGLNNRVIDIEKEVEVLKESAAKRVASETVECSPNE